MTEEVTKTFYVVCDEEHGWLMEEGITNTSCVVYDKDKEGLNEEMGN